MAHEKRDLDRWRRALAEGRVSRRQWLRTMLGLGVSGPLVARHLPGDAFAVGEKSAPPPRAPETPSARGGGGRLRLLWWQAPTILNAHLSSGLKDIDAARVVYEPLAAFNRQGEFVPILAAEIPSLANGGLAPEGHAVTWRLKRGVVWHDGAPFTADDVIFTWEYVADPATAAVTSGSYQNILRLDKRDDYTLTMVFKAPTPFWYDAFFAGRGHILPRHLFAPYKGQNSRNAPYNLMPVGTGPYKIVKFAPGDAALFELNPTYHVPNRPFFDAVELKGGGDAASAARAVLQTGEYDFAWNLQVEKEVLERMERPGGRGNIHIYPGAGVEHVQLNRTDPETEIEGERSSLQVPHPFLTDLMVRQAYSLLMDRQTIAQELYGSAAQATGNFLNTPQRFKSPNTRWEFNPQKAAQLLDQAGWKRNGHAIRVKDGRRMKVLFQTSVNPVRAKTQSIIKKAFEQVGIEVELKAINPAIFFSSDPGNPDTFARFHADLQMFTVTPGAPDPQAHMSQFVSWEIARKANHWAGQNVVRWVSAEYDRLWKQAEAELDQVKRAALFIRMNDLLIEDVAVVPLVWRNEVVAISQSLHGMELSTWDSNLWDLAYWYRQG